MIARIIENHAWRNKEYVYADRWEAGQVLASLLKPYCVNDVLILSIPSGGVPVGLEIARLLQRPFDLTIIRKIPIQGNTEAGFGAISLEGDVILDDMLIKKLMLSRADINRLIEPVAQELEERNRVFRSKRPFPNLMDKMVVLVDDGLASGYTMQVAAKVVARKRPASVYIAVPTGPARTIKKLQNLVETIICPNIREGFSFAVASAYMSWYDLNSSEVLHLLRHAPWIQEKTSKPNG